MYDAILTNSQPPPQPQEAQNNEPENGTQSAILPPNKPAKTKKKTGLLILALLPILGAIVASRINITPASDPLPSSPSQGQQTETNPQIAEAKTPNSTEGDGVDLDALIVAINQSKDNAKQSLAIARENLDYSMVNLLLSQMRDANKAPHYTPPDKWWLAKAKEKAEQFKNRTANLGDFTTYKGIKNWQTWLTEVNALLVIHDLLIESGKGNQIQILPNPNLAVSLSQYMRFTELAIAGDTQALEQMKAQAEAQKNADKYNKEAQKSYDKSITNTN